MLRLAQERDELRIVADQFDAPTWSRTNADITARVIAQIGAGTQGQDRWQQVSGLYHMTAQGQTSRHGFAQAILAHPAMAKKPSLTPIAT
jgi:dTDP-4-dehydrorhamnose reductase